MEFIQQAIDYLLRIDVHLNDLMIQYGAWSYAILFAIIFSETGLVVAPFLPGDSLLFAAGAFAAKGSLDSLLLFAILSAAAILGNLVNYWIGYWIGPKILAKKNVRFINLGYLARAHRFYEKHGGKTILVARFLPILRTFAPFVAGIGYMSYGRFMVFSVAAGLVWVGTFIFGGYYFGNLPAVKEHFSVIIAAIIVLSALPALFEFLRHTIRTRRQEGAAAERE